MALTLREYTIAFLLFGFALGTVTTLESTFLNTYDTHLNGSSQETLNQLKKDVDQNRVDVEKVRNDAGNIQSQLGIIGVSKQIIGSVIGGITQVPRMANVLIQNLGLTQHIYVFLLIPVAAVIWELISYARQYRT